MKLQFLIAALFLFNQTYSQNVGIGTSAPATSAILDVNSTTQGLLPPRMTAAQRMAIATPAEGLLVYQTDAAAGFYYIKSGIWTGLNDAPKYPGVTICTQQWMDKNLDVTTYRNGDPIPYVTNPAAWAALTTGAWCYWENNPAFSSAPVGKLYNWYAVNDPRGLAPAGWHVPTFSEWGTLTSCLGGSAVAGGAMKVAGPSQWGNLNGGATNSSGFAALPGGYRTETGAFSLNILFGNFWSSTQNSTLAISTTMIDNSLSIGAGAGDKKYGLSVRCLRD
jgi:uncharacterized protein (TIGR02145 family)